MGFLDNKMMISLTVANVQCSQMWIYCKFISSRKASQRFGHNKHSHKAQSNNVYVGLGCCDQYSTCWLLHVGLEGPRLPVKQTHQPSAPGPESKSFCAFGPSSVLMPQRFRSVYFFRAEQRSRTGTEQCSEAQDWRESCLKNELIQRKKLWL